MKTSKQVSQGGGGRVPRLGATALLALSIMLGLAMIVATRILTFYLVAAVRGAIRKASNLTELSARFLKVDICVWHIVYSFPPPPPFLSPLTGAAPGGRGCPTQHVCIYRLASSMLCVLRIRVLHYAIWDEADAAKLECD